MVVLSDTQIRERVGIEPLKANGMRPGRVTCGLVVDGCDVRVAPAPATTFLSRARMSGATRP
ncbi:MAG: hypothetical protein ACYS0G_06345 [Planctomycetota bacterium]|jgi:hypothetical protein